MLLWILNIIPNVYVAKFLKSFESRSLGFDWKYWLDDPWWTLFFCFGLSHLCLMFTFVTAQTEISEYPGGYSVNFGTQLQLKCVALGDPLPEIAWFQNGEQVS